MASLHARRARPPRPASGHDAGQETWKALAGQAVAHEHKKAPTLGKDLLKQWASLWTFLGHEGAEPTNNRAERNIRPTVVLRKTNGGTSSELGAEFVGNLQSIMLTAKCQGVRVVDWLQTVFEAWWSPARLPLLLPRPTS